MGEGLVPSSKSQSKQQALLLGLASWGQGWPMFFPYSSLSASDQEEKTPPFHYFPLPLQSPNVVAGTPRDCKEWGLQEL